MAGAITDKDLGFNKIKNSIRLMGRGLQVTVGIQGDQAQASRGGITNAKLAAIHEFGAPAAGIPQRSFLRATADRERKAILNLANRQIKKIAGGTDPRAALSVIGEFIRGKVVGTIENSIGLAPNKPATIVRKKSDKPLVDTGQLLGAITSEVKKI